MISEWKKAITSKVRINHQPVLELENKKRERPSMLPENIVSHLMKYIHVI